MIKIVHVMSDGSIKKDITGIVIPYVKETELAYKTVADIASKGGLVNDKKQAAGA